MSRFNSFLNDLKYVKDQFLGSRLHCEKELKKPQLASCSMGLSKANILPSKKKTCVYPTNKLNGSNRQGKGEKNPKQCACAKGEKERGRNKDTEIKRKELERS